MGWRAEIAACKSGGLGVHVRPSRFYDVYIGRGFGTTNERWGRPCPWGNRFKIQGRNTSIARQTAAQLIIMMTIFYKYY